MRPVRTWIGIVLLGLGVIGLLGASGVLDVSTVIEQWWPVAVIGLGAAAMLAQRSLSLGPLVVAAVGVVLLGGTQNWPVQNLLWPILLVVVGVAVLAGLIRRGGAADEGTSLAIFGGTTVRNRSEHLGHAEVSAVFGGATLDLREAHLDDRASVDAFAMFGGVDVLVPKGWRITLRGLPIFGGYEDKTSGDGALPADAPELTVNATALFGGVSVAHKPG